MAVTTAQYILSGIVAAGVAFWYDFNDWKDSGAWSSSQYHLNHYLTYSRNRRHATNASRIFENPAMGPLSALQAPESA
jgi:hypothetical protein